MPPIDGLHVRNTGDGQAHLDTVNLLFDNCLLPGGVNQPPMKIPPGKEIEVPIRPWQSASGNPSTRVGLHSNYAKLISNGFDILDSQRSTIEVLPPGASRLPRK